MGKRLVKQNKFVQGLAPAAVTSVTCDYVSLKYYNHLTVIINLIVSSGTGKGALTFVQATKVDGTSAKALGYKTIYKNTDTSASDALTETAVTSNTHDLGGAAKSMQYVVEIDASDLDVSNDFDCVQAAIADITNGSASVTYILSEPRFIQEGSDAFSAIVD